MDAVRSAHFIGVGGAGMSGIAAVLADGGAAVSGSDLRESRYTSVLREHGVAVSIGHAAENLGEPEVVVVSTAVPETNPELVAARTAGIPVWPRARMLAHVVSDKRTIAVAGTHGKTSTSSMVAAMLEGMGLDPTFLIGGEVGGFGSNARSGAGEFAVIEADESDGSFVHLDPTVAVLTNVEADHLDHYASLSEIEAAFAAFLGKVRPDGVLVVCADDERALALANAAGHRVVTYGSAPDADVRYENISRAEGAPGTEFDVVVDGTRHRAHVSLPGHHMVSNATAAVAVAVALKLAVGDAARALAGFSGVRRRFEVIGCARGVTVVDDYAHHPTEVRATVSAARGLGYRDVIVLFQPHRYSRTEALAEDFGVAFDEADRVVLLDVYSAGEVPIPGITGKTLVDSVLDADHRTRVTYLPHRPDVVTYVVSVAREGDLVMTMGAGDVTALGPEIVRELEASGASVSDA